MTNQIKNFIEEGEKEFEKGYYTFRFEYTDKEGKRRYSINSWNDGMTREETLKKVYQHIDEFPGSRLTDFVENKWIKQFISSRQISLIKMIVESCAEERIKPPHEKEDFPILVENEPLSNKHLINAKMVLENQVGIEYRSGFNEALDTISSKLKELIKE